MGAPTQHQRPTGLAAQALQHLNFGGGSSTGRGLVERPIWQLRHRLGADGRYVGQIRHRVDQGVPVSVAGGRVNGMAEDKIPGRRGGTPEPPARFFAGPEEFAAWLELHHHTETELWMGLNRKHVPDRGLTSGLLTWSQNSCVVRGGF